MSALFPDDEDDFFEPPSGTVRSAGSVAKELGDKDAVDWGDTPSEDEESLADYEDVVELFEDAELLRQEWEDCIEHDDPIDEDYVDDFEFEVDE